MNTISSWIEIDIGSQKMDAYLSLPPTGKGPGILLLQEILGVNSHIRAVADQYAMAGYVVLAPDIFWRIQRRVELGYSEPEIQQALSFWRQVDVPETVSDVCIAGRKLKSMQENSGKTAAVGYCFGGRLAYLAAAEDAVDAAVSYYGGGIQDDLDVAGNVSVPMLFHNAENDHQIPSSAVVQIKEKFTHNTRAEFYIYDGTHHGFNSWDRDAYDQQNSALALGRTLIFLSTIG